MNSFHSSANRVLAAKHAFSGSNLIASQIDRSRTIKQKWFGVVGRRKQRSKGISPLPSIQVRAAMLNSRKSSALGLPLASLTNIETGSSTTPVASSTGWL
jgi:hypothetical protein